MTALTKSLVRLSETLENLSESPTQSEGIKEQLSILSRVSNNHDELIERINILSEEDPFYSILTKSTISTKDYEICQQKWIEQGMETFADYVRYYNNADVIGFVEAVDKMMTNKKLEKGLDMFKMSVSLPGLTERYIFSQLDEKTEYFVGFAEEHKHLAKLMRENIVGGPSIIFHRYHERDVTKIKGKNFCKKIIGFDANSLYPYCMAQKMPTGYYTLQEEENGYKKHTRYSQESIQWLEHLIRTTGAKIEHAENGGEHRYENIEFDGFDRTTTPKTVYEYHGCYYHGHSCGTFHNAEKWKKTMEREEILRKVFKVVSITSCEWKKMEESKNWYPPRSNNLSIEEQNEEMRNKILEDVKNNEIFGFVQVDIHVPEHLIPRFSEFPPIFKNTKIDIADIGEHMKQYCEKIKRRKGVERSLISSMHATDILLLTPLLKWYLRMGLVVTRIRRVISYNGKTVFASFVEKCVNDRRRADLGGVELKMKGEESKTEMNCSYGRTLMNKSIHTSIAFSNKKNLPKHVNSPFLKKYDELNEEVFEVEKTKRKVVHNLPTQIGIAVYSYAKLRMLEFWEFINKYLDNELYQLMEMDTDSLYIAFARDTIDECVKPERRDDWLFEKSEWFSRTDDSQIVFDGQVIPYSQWDKRTPGKFKPEFYGDGHACLNSKVFMVWNNTKDKDGKYKTKLSCKGVQHKRNEILKKHFLSVLETKEPYIAENSGFLKDKNDNITTYTQSKTGMGYFYAKRKVLDDGVSTTHLDI